jgi:Polyketide cyclase / dehydrase and lipid transport
MASVIKERAIDAHPDDVWGALRDFGALHDRLVPGFVVDTQVDDDVRTVTFFNGATARERLVAIDDAARRIAYCVQEGPLPMTHHNASAQVFAVGDGSSRFVWITDVLPDESAPRIAELMEHGIEVIKATMESRRGKRGAA